MLAPQGQRKRVLDLGSPLNLKNPWYLVVRASGRLSKSLWRVLHERKSRAWLISSSKYAGARPWRLVCSLDSPGATGAKANRKCEHDLRLCDCVAFYNTGYWRHRDAYATYPSTLGQPYCRSLIRQRSSRILELSWRYKVLNLTHVEWPRALYEACRALPKISTAKI